MKLSIAIIGLCSEDFITSSISEIESYKSQIELSSISDSNEELLLKYQKIWGIKKLYTDPKDLILTESPDILIISLEPDYLVEIISLAVDQKIKGIILKKPIATSLEISQKIFDLCRLNNIILIVDFKRRWDPLYLNVKEIIDLKILGNLISISGDVSNNTAKKEDFQTIINKYGGGDLLDNGSELIDLIRFFSGEVSSINSIIKRETPQYGSETASNSFFSMHSGVIASLKTNNISAYNNFELDLFFQKGRIKIGKDIKCFYKLSENENQTSNNELIESEFPELIKNKKYNSGAVSEIINNINKHFLPESSGFSAIKNMEVVFGIYYSAYLGGNTVNLPLKIAGNPLQKMFQSGMI